MIEGALLRERSFFTLHPWEEISMRIFLAFLFVAMLSVAATGGARSPLRQPQGRMMPPSKLQCDRNDVTSYDGRVIAYRRRTGSTFLRIRTNFDTTEEVTIRHRGTDDPSKFYLLNGEPFTARDWRRIERSRKVLIKDMRANVWVCRDNPAIQPVVDWRPDDTGAYPRSR
ncbi:MAG: hypothetical protein QOD28_3398 [Acidobacteriota bacterium]|nr:hypothetical protein [Acidobacteriota bacterium]